MTQPTYHYDTYREELGKAYPIFGQALWDPDPGDYPPVEVGDVGFTRRGKFHRLFNTLLREDHPSHQSLGYGLPEYYEQLKILSPNPISYGTLRSTDLHSSGVDMSGGLAATVPGPVGSPISVEASFSCKAKPAAILCLPVDSRSADALPVDHFREWITKHIDSWFSLTNKFKLGVKMEDILLVTGYHRTRSWSNVAFSEAEMNKTFSLMIDITGASIKWDCSKVNFPGALHNHGPNGGEDLPENQCIFVRTFRAKPNLLRLTIKIEAAAEPKPDPREDYDSEHEKEVISVPSVSEYQDPLHVILDYIIKQAPLCDIAVVHDDDLKRILEAGDSASPETLQLDMMDYLERLKPEIVLEIVSTSDTKSINVAMLSAHLKSLATTDRPSSIRLPSHVHVGPANREGSVEDGAPSGFPPSEVSRLNPIRELNIFLQEVQKPRDLTQFLSYRNRTSGPMHQVTHYGEYIFRNLPVGRGVGITMHIAKSAAATQALQFFRANGVPE